jgi:hypothetical protein
VVADLAGDGRTILKLNYGRYWATPGTFFAGVVNPNPSQWWRRYTWSDRNGSGVWERGEEGGEVAGRGGVATESLDPALELPVVQEVAGWIEREMPANVAVRAGVVWRTEQHHFQRQNANQPFEGFTVPVQISDPGPDGVFSTEDDGAEIPGWQLRPDLVGLPVQNIVRNVPDSDSRYWTLDVTVSKRFDGRWSLVAGLAHTWSFDQSGAYTGQSVRQNEFPVTPNDLINAGPEGRYEFRIWTVKIHGTYQAPWDVRITPLLRHQSGQPFGRTIAARLNYGNNIRVLAEPLGTRRMDNITVLDVRVEKGFRLPIGRVAGFVDVFNMLNANSELNISWSSGSFLRPLTILAPRIARIGAKFEW